MLLVFVEMLCVKEVFVAKGRNNVSLYLLPIGHYSLTIDLALPYGANKYYLRTVVFIAHKNPQKLLYVLKAAQKKSLVLRPSFLKKEGRAGGIFFYFQIFFY